MNQTRVKDWRDLCQAAASEQDPNKLIALVTEIIKALENRDKKPGSAPENTSNWRRSSLPHRAG